MLRKPYGWKKEGGRERGRTLHPLFLQHHQIHLSSVLCLLSLCGLLQQLQVSPHLNPHQDVSIISPISHSHCRDPSETHGVLLVFQTNCLLPKRKQFKLLTGPCLLLEYLTLLTCHSLTNLYLSYTECHSYPCLPELALPLKLLNRKTVSPLCEDFFYFSLPSPQVSHFYHCIVPLY